MALESELISIDGSDKVLSSALALLAFSNDGFAAVEWAAEDIPSEAAAPNQ